MILVLGSSFRIRIGDDNILEKIAYGKPKVRKRFFFGTVQNFVWF